MGKLIWTAVYGKHLYKYYRDTHTNHPTQWYTHTHYSARQTNILHSITVMPQREVEMDGYCYERDPHSHEPPLQSFPGPTSFLSVTLATTFSNSRKENKQKNIKQYEFTMDWKEKKQTCRVIWDVESIINSINKTEKQLMFWKFPSIHLAWTNFG